MYTNFPEVIQKATNTDVQSKDQNKDPKMEWETCEM